MSRRRRSGERPPESSSIRCRDAELLRLASPRFRLRNHAPRRIPLAALPMSWPGSLVQSLRTAFIQFASTARARTKRRLPSTATADAAWRCSRPGIRQLRREFGAFRISLAEPRHRSHCGVFLDRSLYRRIVIRGASERSRHLATGYCGPFDGRRRVASPHRAPCSQTPARGNESRARARA